MPVTEPLNRNSVTIKHLNIGKRGGGVSGSGGGSGGSASAGIIVQYGIETSQTFSIPTGVYPISYPINTLDFPKEIKPSNDVTLAPFLYKSVFEGVMEITAFVEIEEQSDLERHVLHILRKQDTQVDVARQYIAVKKGTKLVLEITTRVRLLLDDEISIAVSVANIGATPNTLTINSGQVKISSV
jgi:hypothetical protein